MPKTPLSYCIIILLAFGVSYLGLLFLPKATVQWLGHEDGPFETFGALCFLTSSFMFLSLYIKEKRGNQLLFFTTKRNVFFLLLALVFFLAFGEEVSWGQRLLGFETPEQLAKINRQGEFNIHNINIFHGRDAAGNRKSDLALLLNIDRLFSLFWLIYCVVIPVGVRLHQGMERHLSRLNLPLVPIWLGLSFPVNYLLSKVLVSEALAPSFDEFSAFNHITVEAKESLFAFLFMLVALHFYQRSTKARIRELVES